MNNPPNTTDCHYRLEDDDVPTKTQSDPQTVLPEPKKYRVCCCRLSKCGVRLLCVGIAVLLFGAMFAIILAENFLYSATYIDNGDISINYIDLKGIQPRSNNAEVELSLRIDYSDPLASEAKGTKFEAMTANLAYQRKPFGSVVIPAFDVDSSDLKLDVVFNTSVNVSDAEVFTRMATDVLQLEEITLQVEGDVTAHLKGETWSFETDRKLDIAGFSSFKTAQPVINSVKFTQCDQTQLSIRVDVAIDNTTPWGMGGIGQLNMSVLYEGTMVGYAMPVDHEIGIPRGKSTQAVDLTFPVSPALEQMLDNLQTALQQKEKVEFVVSGANPVMMQDHLLKETMQSAMVTMGYTNGLDGVSFGDGCTMEELAAIGSEFL